MNRAPRTAAVLALFFLSGATSLVYEVVWSRSLALTFGITTHAVATVLCAFMGGLALGSFLVSRFGSRLGNPLAAYGWLELLIGLFALVFPWVQDQITGLYVQAVRSAGGERPPVLVLFSMAAACLMVPSTLMGATFPLFVQAMVRDPARIGVSVGAVYAFNTLGAVAGTVAAGFWLIEDFGMSGATWIAAAGNAVVFLGAVLVGRSGEEAPAPEPVPAAAGAGGRALVLFAIGVSGMASLTYQILWTRVLTFFVHNSTYAFSGMLAVFLIGLALGSLAVGFVLDRIPRRGLWFLFAALEVLIALSVVYSVQWSTELKEFVFEWFPKLTGRTGITSWWDSTLVALFQSAIVLLPPTLLMGATFPVAGRLYLDDPGEAARRIGEVYSANTLGSILGAFVGGFVLLEVLGGVAPAFLAMIAANLLVALLLVLLGQARWLERSLVVAGAAAVVALGVGIFRWETVRGPDGQDRKEFAVFRRVAEQRYGTLAYYREGVTDTTWVVEKYRSGQDKPFLFYGDGRGVAGVGTYQENRMSGHLPLLLHGAPKDVLVICFGVGNTLGAMTRHADLRRLDCVELSPHVRETSRFFTERNHDPLAHPKVRLVVQDGRNHLLATDARYDVIGLEPPEIHTAGVVNLYTKEFYQLCRERMTDAGVMIQWFNMGVTPEDVSRMLVKAMDEVFPHTTLWQAPQYYSWLIVGSKQPLRIDYQRLAARMAQPDIHQDLAEAGIAEPMELLSWLVMGEGGVDRYVHGVPVITDDKTIVDFLAPKSHVTRFGVMQYSTAYSEDLFQLRMDKEEALRQTFANVHTSWALRESPEPLLENLPAERDALLLDLARRVEDKKDGNRKWDATGKK